MYRRLNWTGSWIVFLIAVVLLFAGSQPVQAASTPKKAYAINAQLPANQVDNALQYWEPRLAPNQEQTLNLQLANIGSQSITITVYANNGTTDSNPQIIYDRTAPAVYPKTAVSFASLVQGPRKKQVTLKPARTTTVSFKIRAPAKQFNGMILGGLYTVADVTTDANATVRSRVGYQRSVVLQGNDINQVKPKLHFGTVKPAVQADNMVLRLATTNSAKMYGEAINTDMQVNRQGDVKRLVHRTSQDGKIAPNSRFDWQFNIHKLPAGNYTMKLVVSGNNVPKQTITRNFTIEGSQVQSVADYLGTNSPGKLTIIIILGILIGILLIGGWVLLYNRARMNNK